MDGKKGRFKMRAPMGVRIEKEQQETQSEK